MSTTEEHLLAVRYQLSLQLNDARAHDRGTITQGRTLRIRSAATAYERGRIAGFITAIYYIDKILRKM